MIVSLCVSSSAMQDPEEIGGRRFVAALQVPPHTAPKQNIGKWSLLGALPRDSGVGEQMQPWNGAGLVCLGPGT